MCALCDTLTHNLPTQHAPVLLSCCCPSYSLLSADPTVLDLATFKHEVLAPFILSEEQHAQACRMSISHDSAMPQPEEEEFDPLGMAPGGGAVPQPPPGTQDAAANVPQQPQPQPQGSSSSDSGAGSRRQHNGKL